MVFIIGAMVAAAAPAVAVANPEPMRRVEKLAEERWREEQDANIVLRVRLGLPVTAIPVDTEADSVAAAARARTLLHELATIPPDRLDEDRRALYDILRRRAQDDAEAARFHWFEFTIVPYALYRKIDAINAYFATAPLTTDAQRAAYLALIEDYARLFDAQRVRLEGQAARGIRLPRAAIPGVVSMLRTIEGELDAKVGIDENRARAIPDKEKARFRADAAALVAGRLRQGIEALLACLQGPYQAAAPAAVGLSMLPGGRAYYAHLIRRSTSLSLTASEIHELGLRRVAELRAEILKAAREVGLTGDLPTIYAALRRDPRFIAKAPEETRDRYRGYIAEIEPQIPRFFSHTPRAAFDVRRLAPQLEASLTFGYYQPPTDADPTGYYVFNGSDVEQRSLLTAQAVIYHELVPGHHFQVATQLERADLPPIRQRYEDNAFAEGWAEYAAGLGEEMGVYDDPHRRIGRRLMEMFFAVRLVVDTGLGDRGWSLRRARAYMADHLFLSRTEIDTESLRYATRPGQALAYRLGYEHFRDLRARARRELGDRFDIRDFHALILDGGTLPLTSVTGRVDRWIAQRRKLAAQ